MNPVVLDSPLATTAATERPLHRLLHRLVLWRQRVRQRRALGELNDHLLKDIGLSRADVWQEARKPFWEP